MQSDDSDINFNEVSLYKLFTVAYGKTARETHI